MPSLEEAQEVDEAVDNKEKCEYKLHDVFTTVILRQSAQMTAELYTLGIVEG